MDLTCLDEELSSTISAAWSTNTLSVRNSQWSKLIKFCSDINERPLPASHETVGRFLVWLGRSSKYSTINNYLSAIISLHWFYGYNPEFRDSFFLKMILKGLKMRLGDTVAQMQSLSVRHLGDMYASLDISSEYNETMWTIMIVSFRSLLRKSNLVPTTKFDERHVLKRSDVLFHNWGITLLVPSTKTLQCAEYILEIPIYYVSDKRFCAASALLHHFALHPAPASSVMFLKRPSNGLVPVMYRDLLDLIKKLVTRIGLDSSKHGCHSLRRSGAGFLHSINVPLQDIMSMGDWRSLSVLDYLVTPLHRKKDIQPTVALALSVSI